MSISRAQSYLLLHEVNTNSQWERLMQMEGLTVVDIYSECFGPCSAMIRNLRNLRRQARNNLHVAIAKSDNIKCLEQFRNKSEPTWMFLAGGKIIKLMQGADAPKLIRMILDELKNEVAITAGKRTRSEIDVTDFLKDEELSDELVEAEKEDDYEMDEEKENKPVPVIIRDEEFLYRPF